jgi:hypothetical protein
MLDYVISRSARTKLVGRGRYHLVMVKLFSHYVQNKRSRGEQHTKKIVVREEHLQPSGGISKLLIKKLI